jgi:hypothetical protein
MEIGVEAFDLFASSMDEACQRGHLPNPSHRILLQEETNSANTESYLLAIRSRLIDLGYLGESTENRSKRSLDDRLKAAIKNFQKEARLTEDAWVGPVTWNTLQQLVSFEDEQDPAFWRDELLRDPPPPAVLRAVYLRLYAFGFFEWRKKLNLRTDISLESNTDFSTALKKFLKTARAIGILKKEGDPIINLEILRTLFQQNEIIHALGRSPDFVSDKKNKKFVEAVARIEFWMLGFDVNIGSSRVIFRRRVGQKFKERTTRLSLAMMDFWQQQPAESRPKLKWNRENVTPEFFQQLVLLEDEDEEDQDADNFVEENLVNRISSFSIKEQDLLKRRLNDIAGSIWDGVKRVFRWIKRFVKKIVSTALNLVKNIARFIAKHSRYVFGTVRNVIEILHRGTVYLRNKLLPGSDALNAAIYHDRDFDAAIFFNLAADSQAVKRLLTDNRRESICFGAACRILGHLIGILRQVARAFAAGIGWWFLALLALARLALRIKEIVREVAIVKSFDAASVSTPFANRVN